MPINSFKVANWQHLSYIENMDDEFVTPRRRKSMKTLLHMDSVIPVQKIHKNHKRVTNDESRDECVAQKPHLSGRTPESSRTIF
ncbi:MAG: hypothetical protein H0X31_01390 [Nostocaceae cyanobacterium]|nr:hypothetical protein [Nostocaceae cyanobacterium]